MTAFNDHYTVGTVGFKEVQPLLIPEKYLPRCSLFLALFQWGICYRFDKNPA
jgi:hypothetical protein